MPLTNPAYPPGPYRFVDREYLTITYRTDPAKLRTVVPEPLEYNEHEPVHTENLIRVDDVMETPKLLNDRAVLVRSGRPYLAIQVEVTA